MSENGNGGGHLKRFTPETAPRQGGKLGRRIKLNRQAWAALEDVLENHEERGLGAIDTLRIESPERYQRLVLAAAEIVLKYSQDKQLDLGEDGTIRVRWLKDDEDAEDYPTLTQGDE